MVAAGASAYSASSSRKQGKQAAAAAEKQRAAQVAALSKQQGNLEGLYGEQRDPAEVYREIFEMLPELLKKHLPSFRQFSKETAEDFTTSNLDIREDVINRMFPEFNRLQGRRVAMIDEMDPENLGQEELKAITRKLSPLIPEGTLDPTTGAVAGGTTSPVSLYRNLISGAYQQRRTDYMAVNNAYLSDAESSAARQQEKASTFLPQFLNLAGGAASELTGLTVAQESAEIANSEAYLRALLGMPAATYDAAAYDRATGQNLQGVIAGLSTAADAYSRSNAGTSAQGRASAVQSRPASATTSYSVGASQPSNSVGTGIANYKSYLS